MPRRSMRMFEAVPSKGQNIDITQVLGGLSDIEVEAILGMTEDKSYTRGTCIFNLGEQQRGLYLVKSGLVEEFRITESGNRLPIGRVMPGRLFGLSSKEGTYCCFTQALDESVVGFLAFPTLEDVCRKYPRVAVNLVELLARRLGEFEERLESLAFSGLRARVSWALLGLSATHGAKLSGITHEALAEWVAGSRPKVSQVLEELQQAGVLHLSRSEIEILDSAGLEDRAKEIALG
ncbi:MAG: Crp/Fnr family transcriptional regulator [Chloroflexi bacterium]|nr:Crp/Fnr family transcriptional regulator [Chloroflexota bacterium]